MLKCCGGGTGIRGRSGGSGWSCADDRCAEGNPGRTVKIWGGRLGRFLATFNPMFPKLQVTAYLF